MNTKIAAVILVALSLPAACGRMVESTFWLNAHCRLPKWITLPPNTLRQGVTLKLNTYVERKGRVDEFILYGRAGQQIAIQDGSVKGLEPIKLKNSDGSFSNYEIVTVNNITDVLKYIYNEHGVQFCMVDDTSIWRQLGLSENRERIPISGLSAVKN